LTRRSMSTVTEQDMWGVYTFQYGKSNGGVGEFEVHLRTDCRFFSPDYQQPATWTLDPPLKKVSIEWKKYGQYELTQGDDGKWSGSMVGKPESWRKMEFKRPFTTAEMQVFDSEWEFIHSGGSFPVKFKADGYNHFICDQFPAHSHWKLKDGDKPTPTINIDWGKYGKYDLVIDEKGENMTGSAVGNPGNWRKAKRIGKMNETGDVHVHDH